MRLYFNPRCSKSRTARALLEEAGHRPAIVDYLAEPLDHTMLASLLDSLDTSPATLVRTDDPAFATMNISSDELDRERVIALLLAHPALMQRPVLDHDGRALIARPPARVFELLDPQADGDS